MKQRFQKERDCTNEFMMMSKMKSLSILAYDRIRLNVNTLKEKSTMKLLNVCYVFDFMINIVANSIFENKDVHFNTEHRHLYRKETQISHVLVSKVDAHYVLEDNRSEKMSIFAVIVRKETTVAEKVKLTNKNKMSTSSATSAATSKKSIF